MRALLTLFAAAALSGAAGAAENEWDRFRGPNGDGLGPDGALPVEFTPEDALFRVALPTGHSSPILAGGRVHVTAFEDEAFLTIALDQETGDELWRSVAARERFTEVDNRNNAASPSVVATPDEVYAFFPDLGLIAYDGEGGERWRLPLGPFDNLYGMGASPILVEDMVVLVLDQNLDSEIIAVSRDGGEIRWRTERPEATSGHSTPVLRETSEGLEILAPGSFLLTAYAAADGARRWWVRGLPWEMKSTPLIDDDFVYVNGYGAPLNQPGNQRTAPSFSDALAASDTDGDGGISREEAEGHPSSWFGVIDLNRDDVLQASEWTYYEAVLESQNGVLAIRPGAEGETGDLTERNTAWSYRRRVPQLPSPLLYGGVFYMVNDGGVVTALDPQSGERLSQARLRGAVDAYYASPVAADGKIYFISELGLAAVVRPLEPGEETSELEVLHVNTLGEAVYATPAIAPSRLYIRTVENLYAFGPEPARP